MGAGPGRKRTTADSGEGVRLEQGGGRKLPGGSRPRGCRAYKAVCSSARQTPCCFQAVGSQSLVKRGQSSVGGLHMSLPQLLAAKADVQDGSHLL